MNHSKCLKIQTAVVYHEKKEYCVPMFILGAFPSYLFKSNAGFKPSLVLSFHVQKDSYESSDMPLL